MEIARLAVTNLCKAYSTPVLNDIDLSIAPGEVRAIVGENGAGKTTLVNILSGLLRKDSGKLTLDGRLYEPSNTREGIGAGVSCATQELSIVDTLSVGENILLKRLPHKYWAIAAERVENRARELLDLVGLEHISATMRAEELSLAERQLVELAKALETRCGLLILDEPTAALNAMQAARLHDIIGDLAASGTSVIYISHRLNDVLRIADSITILRDGQVVESRSTEGISVAEIIEKMSGRHREGSKRGAQASHETAVALEVHGITTKDLPSPISFSCRQGEVVGIAGLAGSGRTELLDAIFGLTTLTDGYVSRRIGDETIMIDSPRHAANSGIGYVGEDRQVTGLFPGLSIASNMTLPGISRVASPLGLLNRGRERAHANELIGKLSVKCTGPDQDVDELSGGNQQKVLIARWLHCDSDVLLLDEPTRGVDIATKNAIYDLVFEMQTNGKVILVASSEIEELLTLCSRILVLSSRKLVREFSQGEWSETDILAAAFQEHTSGRPVAGAQTVNITE